MIAKENDIIIKCDVCGANPSKDGNIKENGERRYWDNTRLCVDCKKKSKYTKEIDWDVVAKDMSMILKEYFEKHRDVLEELRNEKGK